MPELPEVETSRLGILPHLKGQKIAEIIIRQPKLRWLIDKEILSCQGEWILDIQRRAKYLLLKLSQHWIVIHLGMSGHLRILKEGKDAGKHDHVDLILENGSCLRYTDPRRFGMWLWCTELAELSQLRQLGKEPLNQDFTGNYLYQQLRRCRLAIKSALMTTRIVVGIGNIYANESLFMARIHPERSSCTLSKTECIRLANAIKIILNRAITQGGTTLRDFLHSDGKAGYFIQELQVYGRAQMPCPCCQTTLKSIRIARRNTFFCPHCQH